MRDCEDVIIMSQLKRLAMLSINLETADYERSDWIWDHSDKTKPFFLLTTT